MDTTENGEDHAGEVRECVLRLRVRTCRESRVHLARAATGRRDTSSVTRAQPVTSDNHDFLLFLTLYILFMTWPHTPH